MCLVALSIRECSGIEGGLYQSNVALQKFATSLFPKPSPFARPKPTATPTNNKATMKFSHKAYLKPLAHATKYPTGPVNGVFLAETNSTNLVVDAVPLFHFWGTLTPMLEVAMTQVCTQFISREGKGTFSLWRAGNGDDDTDTGGSEKSTVRLLFRTQDLPFVGRTTMKAMMQQQMMLHL